MKRDHDERLSCDACGGEEAPRRPPLGRTGAAFPRICLVRSGAAASFCDARLPASPRKDGARGPTWLVICLVVSFAPAQATTTRRRSPGNRRRGGWDEPRKRSRRRRGGSRRADTAGARRMLEAARAAGGEDPRVPASRRGWRSTGAGIVRPSHSRRSRWLTLPVRVARCSRGRAPAAALGDSAGALAISTAWSKRRTVTPKSTCLSGRTPRWKLAGAAPALAASGADARRALDAGRGARSRRSSNASWACRSARARSARAAARSAGASSAEPLRADAASDTLLPLGATWRWFAGLAAPAGAWPTPAMTMADGARDRPRWATASARIATPLPYGGNTSNRWVTSYCARTSPGRPARPRCYPLSCRPTTTMASWLT